VTRSDRRR